MKAQLLWGIKGVLSSTRVDGSDSDVFLFVFFTDDPGCVNVHFSLTSAAHTRRGPHTVTREQLTIESLDESLLTIWAFRDGGRGYKAQRVRPLPG